MKETERCAVYASLNLTTYHYKVLFLLMSKSLTQSQIGDILGVKKQNIYSVCRDLKSMDLIIEDEKVGNNVYLKINSNPQIQMKGQLNILNLG